MTPSSATARAPSSPRKIAGRRGLGDRGRRVLASTGSTRWTTACTPSSRRRPRSRGSGPRSSMLHRGTGAPQHPVAGIPLALKDVLATKGIRTTCGSKILENYVPPYESHALGAPRRARRVLMGKTNCDEFAMGSSNENSAFGPVHNPWDLERVPGGSSGGSAAAVAAGRGRLGARHRHRWVGPPAGLALRRRGPEADVRAGLPVRPDRVRLVAGHGGDAHAERARRRAVARRDGGEGSPRRHEPRARPLPDYARGHRGRRRRDSASASWRRRSARVSSRASETRCAPRSTGSQRSGPRWARRRSRTPTTRCPRTT